MKGIKIIIIMNNNEIISMKIRIEIINNKIETIRHERK